MDQEIRKEFDELTLIIRDSFGELESRMATKEDLQEVKSDVRNLKEDLQEVKSDLQHTGGELKEMRVEMETGFASVHAELADIKTQIRDLDNRMEKLFKVETEDVSAFYRDFTELKRRVEKIEKFVQLQAV